MFYGDLFSRVLVHVSGYSRARRRAGAGVALTLITISNVARRVAIPSTRQRPCKRDNSVLPNSRKLFDLSRTN